MGKRQPDWDFRMMALTFKVRDLVAPRMRVLQEAGIRPGFHVLDYGCGPGSYIVPLVNLVGESGKVYAVDIHPLAVESVQNMVSKRQLPNVEAILSGCETGLPDSSVDAVVMYDALHGLEEPGPVLRELHRVMKVGSILSVNDHHLKDEEIVNRVTLEGLFRLSARGKRTQTFRKANGGP